MAGGLIASGVAGVIEGTGKAVSTVWSTIKGDKGATNEAVHKEQIAVIEQYAAESKGRTTATWWDSMVDGINRLVRPALAFGVVAILVWSIYDPVTFVEIMGALAVVPDEMWLMLLGIVVFYFGGRIISQDIQKPKMALESMRLALEIARSRAERLAAAEAKKVKAQEIGQPPPIVVTPAEILPKVTRDNAAVDAMIADLIVREAGYVNDSVDRGGPTKYGITQDTLADYRGIPVSASDVRALTKVEATKIYRNTFYLAPQIYLLPVGIQPQVFDICVNSGPKNAIRLLQRALNRHGADLIEDGVFGPATMVASKSYPAATINRTLAGVRLTFYEAIVDNDPTQIRFLDNWRKRAALFLV